MRLGLGIYVPHNNNYCRCGAVVDAKGVHAMACKKAPCKIALSRLVTFTFELLTFELVRNVSRGTDKFPANVSDSATFRCRVIGKHASD